MIYHLENNKIQFLTQYNSNNEYNIIFNPLTTSISMWINSLECYDSFKEKSQPWRVLKKVILTKIVLEKNYYYEREEARVEN